MPNNESVWSSEWLYMRLESLERGVKDCAGPPDPAIVLHIGHSLRLNCDFEGRRHRGMRVHGDINVIPAQMPSRWETAEEYTELSIRLPGKLIHEIARDAQHDVRRIGLREQFQLRDVRLQHVSLALLAEWQAGFPSGRLCSESLATALGTILVQRHSTIASDSQRPPVKVASRRLKQMLAYIEDNLGGHLTLAGIAQAAGLSISHCKATFRDTMGMPVHQYVIQRRVELARRLLVEGAHSIPDVALLSGFSSPSHLALHVRRLLGVSPRELRKYSRT